VADVLKQARRAMMDAPEKEIVAFESGDSPSWRHELGRHEVVGSRPILAWRSHFESTVATG